MIKPNGCIVPALKCATCPINVGCSWECLRGDDLCEIAELREALRDREIGRRENFGGWGDE